MGYYKKELLICKLLILDFLINIHPPGNQILLNVSAVRDFFIRNSFEFPLMISLYNYPNSNVEVSNG
jgi:hypothetical protein